jgi:hypothetical protein
MDAPEQHQRKIAEDTLRMPAAMRDVMGGPTLEEAESFLQEHVKVIVVGLPRKEDPDEA